MCQNGSAAVAIPAAIAPDPKHQSLTQVPQFQTQFLVAKSGGVRGRGGVFGTTFPAGQRPAPSAMVPVQMLQRRSPVWRLSVRSEAGNNSIGGAAVVPVQMWEKYNVPVQMSHLGSRLPGWLSQYRWVSRICWIYATCPDAPGCPSRNRWVSHTKYLSKWATPTQSTCPNVATPMLAALLSYLSKCGRSQPRDRLVSLLAPWEYSVAVLMR